MEVIGNIFSRLCYTNLNGGNVFSRLSYTYLNGGNVFYRLWYINLNGGNIHGSRNGTMNIQYFQGFKPLGLT